jgi:hypothetical protein
LGGAGLLVYAFGDSRTVVRATGFDEETGAPRLTTSAAKVVVATSRVRAAMVVFFMFPPMRRTG